jgi:RNA-directed DNA polymerase
VYATVKSYSISKQVVLEAWEQVKANKGAAGVDSESLEDFEKNLEKNLYKIWNRMSSGSYFPPPVKTVDIPKRSGGKRSLGIPTVSDRVAQTVAKMYLEPLVEKHFHNDSYGYRPGKSAIDAVGTARERCWKFDWVIDLDIKGFFDNLDHKITMQSVRKYTDCEWILLYVERWLKAPAQLEDGTLVTRDKGTPQGGVISPLLANIVLHLAFDTWMEKEFPNAPFERYADDMIVHCGTEKQADFIRWCIEKRLARFKLEFNLEKTKLVYCKDNRRLGEYPTKKFDFLGYTFRRRMVRGKIGVCFLGFNPGVSNAAKKSMNQKMRRWELHQHSSSDLSELAQLVNPQVRGWINYYGKFNKSELLPVFTHLNDTLIKWVKWKYKRFRYRTSRARHWLGNIAKEKPTMFAHWQMLGIKPTVR